MIKNLKLAKVDTKYCDYLKKFDKMVAYNKYFKELRTFVGILFTIDECLYFASLSSPKKKHLKMKNTIDFYNIDDDKLGTVNFNNMIPVKEEYCEVILLYKDIFDDEEQKYQELLKDKFNWLNKHYNQIKNISKKLYDMYNSNKLPSSIKERCCNYKLLEDKCLEYNK